MRTTKMLCRIEELPFFSGLLCDNLARDKVDFSNFSGEFGDGYLQKMTAQTKLVKEVIAPSLLMAEQKAITVRIDANYTTTRNYANKVERYAEMADESKLLGISVSDFGFKGLRSEVAKNNDEGVIKKLGELLQTIAANHEALEAKGFTPAAQQELAAFVATFEADVLSQKRKMAERNKLVADNAGQFDTLWNMISNILETGKVIYKEKDKAKVKDYTYAELIKKVRLQRKKEEDTIPPATETGQK